MSSKGHRSASAARNEIAAAWRIRSEADAAVLDSAEFQEWFGDPLNREAYAEMCASWDAFEDHLASPELIAVRRDALARAHRTSIYRVFPTRARIAAIAAALLLLVGGSLGLERYLTAPTEYATGIGERRTFALDDGSRVSLDSDTDLTVRYTKLARKIVLLTGRARFDVAHDIARPFTVTAGRETVVAVGTAFNVEKLGDKVLVTLIEGHVVVKSAIAPDKRMAASKPVSLIAGQELVVASANPKPEVVQASLPAETAWESGHLVLNDEPLAEAVERMNRYASKPLIVDPSVAQLRVSGVFNSGDVNAFVDAITNYFPVQASTTDDNRIVLQKKS